MCWLSRSVRMPVPFPTCFVEKNGSNTRSRIASGIPVPVSLTAIMT